MNVVEKFELVKSYEIDVAHQLPWHKGKCSRLHGHTIRIDIYLTFNELNENGVAMDFHDIDWIVKPVIDELDHKYLNDILENPTMENLARYIWDKLSGKLPLSKLVLWESSKSRVEYTKRVFS